MSTQDETILLCLSAAPSNRKIIPLSRCRNTCSCFRRGTDESSTRTTPVMPRWITRNFPSSRSAAIYRARRRRFSIFRPGRAFGRLSKVVCFTLPLYPITAHVGYSLKTVFCLKPSLSAIYNIYCDNVITTEFICQ